MSENKQLAETREVKQADIMPGFGSLKSFELAQRTATLLAKSTLVPKEYQEDIPNCVIALNMANRMNADPLMVMQNLYIVHGKPSWSSQFLISTFNTSGRFTALRYEWSGTPGKDDYGCKAWAVEKATGEKLEGTLVTIDIAKKEGWYSKNGSKWKTMPQQMLTYRAAAWFVRAYTPELAMGMHTEYEIMDAEDQDRNVQDEIDSKANSEVIDIEPEQVSKVEPEPEEVKEEKAPGKEEKSKEEKKDKKTDQVKMDGPGF